MSTSIDQARAALEAALTSVRLALLAFDELDARHVPGLTHQQGLEVIQQSLHATRGLSLLYTAVGRMRRSAQVSAVPASAPPPAVAPALPAVASVPAVAPVDTSAPAPSSLPYPDVDDPSSGVTEPYFGDAPAAPVVADETIDPVDVAALETDLADDTAARPIEHDPHQLTIEDVPVLTMSDRAPTKKRRPRARSAA